MTIEYQITFFSEWHCGSGMSAGFGADLTVIRDEDGLPFIPGKTIKGLLRDASQNLAELNDQNKDSWQDFIKTVFGTGDDTDTEHFIPSDCFFSDAELPGDIRQYLLENPRKKQFLYRETSSTEIGQDGLAKKHSLRGIETVIPLTLNARISGSSENADHEKKLATCMKWTKRLGVHRNRGLGRCSLEIISNGGESI